MTRDPYTWMIAEARERERLGLQRSLVEITPGLPGRVILEERELIDFSSNDYLGLSRDPRLIEAASEAAGRFGWGAAASPLVSGWKAPHWELAKALADFEQAEAVALFPTGYSANLGTVAALVGPGDAVFSDRWNHSSLIMGARLSGARLRVYPHGDADRLSDLLDRDRGRYRRVLIVTDGVFSMDGDLAPLPELVAVADRFEAMLLVDEAHGTGVFGETGRGAAEHLGVADRIPVRVGTLSKSLGSIGGFVAGDRTLINHLIHHAPSLMYSTAMPPAAAAAAAEALRVIQAEPWRREHLHRLSAQLRDKLRDLGLSVPGVHGPIVPVLLGEPLKATAMASAMRQEGFFVPAIRPPTVPKGSSRLRLSLSAAHGTEEISALIGALERRALE